MLFFEAPHLFQNQSWPSKFQIPGFLSRNGNPKGVRGRRLAAVPAGPLRSGARGSEPQHLCPDTCAGHVRCDTRTPQGWVDSSAAEAGTVLLQGQPRANPHLRGWKGEFLFEGLSDAKEDFHPRETSNYRKAWRATEMLPLQGTSSGGILKQGAHLTPRS